MLTTFLFLFGAFITAAEFPNIAAYAFCENSRLAYRDKIIWATGVTLLCTRFLN